MTEPVIPVPLHVAAWLHRRLRPGVAALVAGHDPVLDDVLRKLAAADLVEAELRTRRDRGTPPPPPQEQQPRSVTTGAAAQRLGITRRGVRQAITRGRLPAQDVDGRYLIDTTDLDTYASQRTDRRSA